MSSKYKFWDPDEIYFVTFAVVDWIDLFIRNEYKDILLESWRFCIKYKGMELFAWSRLRRDDKSCALDSWLRKRKIGRYYAGYEKAHFKEIEKGNRYSS